jgi:hypothetical protein
VFGHGIRSDYMDFMFIYPFIGGGFVAVCLVVNKNISRFGFNIFNAGIATLTVGAFLK